MTDSIQVSAYLSALPDDQRAALEQLRHTIKAIAPDAVEGLSYGVPALKLNKKSFVSFGAGKGHCAFYVQSPAVMEAHAEDLRRYDTAKGTVRFRPDAPLPDALVRKLVLARVAEVGAPAKKR
jgi:uncharacterized protein YdhG (YjbR/CyaY superfamily)